MRSGILFTSVGQLVGLPVDSVSLLYSLMALSNYFPLVVVSQDPQWVCFAFESPHMTNLFFCKSRYSFSLIECFGGQYTDRYYSSVTIFGFIAYRSSLYLFGFIFNFFMMKNIVSNYYGTTSFVL